MALVIHGACTKMAIARHLSVTSIKSCNSTSNYALHKYTESRLLVFLLKTFTLERQSPQNDYDRKVRHCDGPGRSTIAHLTWLQSRLQPLQAADPHQLHEPAGVLDEERQKHAAHDLEDGTLQRDHHHTVGQQQDPPAGHGRRKAVSEW